MSFQLPFSKFPYTSGVFSSKEGLASQTGEKLKEVFKSSIFSPRPVAYAVPVEKKKGASDEIRPAQFLSVSIGLGSFRN